MAIGAIFPSVCQARRRARKATWQLRYRTAQIVPNVVLVLFLYLLFLTLFLVSATTIAAERVAGCAIAVKALATKWLLISGLHDKIPVRDLFT